jgi:hypothetical protein
MMKETPWKLIAGGKERIRAKYGLDYAFARRNGQQPYFSVTGETECKDDRRPNHWRDDSAGAIHNEIAAAFPELRPYIKWHLVSLGEPMHYLANAKYWWEKLTGVVTPGTRPDAPGSPNPMETFKSTIVFGVLPDDVLPVSTTPWRDVEAWLRERLPRLMGRFAADMRDLGVLE